MRNDGVRRRRFLAEAEKRGFVFSADVLARPRRVSARGAFWRGAVAASVAATIVASAWFWKTTRSRPAVTVSALKTTDAATSSEGKTQSDAERIQALTLEVERARRVERASAARAAASEAARVASERQVTALRRELNRAGSDRSVVQRRLESAQQALEARVLELTDAKRQNASDAMLLDLQDARLTSLSARLRESDEQIGRQGQLLAADRDIRDLMGARNLHVIDVFDVDGRGKTRRAFGRAFYTEGKSLIFYAFDLSTASTQTASFQAWGQREDGGHAAMSLGLLYSDDHTQNRWTLKFEDARVLQEIDAMFVTVEPPGGSRVPRGRKLLYAYLRQKPNHP
jgi:hypothetical protein